PRDPPTSSKAESSSAYDSTTHGTPIAVAFSSFCKNGSATLTTVPSMKAMLEARIVAARTHRPTLASQPFEGGPERTEAFEQGSWITADMTQEYRINVTTICLTSIESGRKRWFARINLPVNLLRQ